MGIILLEVGIIGTIADRLEIPLSLPILLIEWILLAGKLFGVLKLSQR
jgi:hypothetical protein